MVEFALETPQSRAKMEKSDPVPGAEVLDFHSKNEDGGGHAVSSDVAQQQISQEIPFLVTHWLANYEKSKSTGSGDEKEKAAMARIRNATSEIASAFATLGAYGTTLRVSCNVVHYFTLLPFRDIFWSSRFQLISHLTHTFCLSCDIISIRSLPWNWLRLHRCPCQFRTNRSFKTEHIVT